MMGSVAVILCLSALAAPVEAQPLHAQPASLLIFPLYNSTQGNNTLITMTNTNEDESACSSGFRQGDIQLHYVYFSETCQESDTQEDLTPADTITVLARGHNPNFEKGYLLVEARDPELQVPTLYNHLIGSGIVVNSEFDFQWAYTPYAFEAIFDFDALNGLVDGCGRKIVPDTDDIINFDGYEYSSFPDVLLLDHFFGEGTPENGPGVTFDNMIFLMSTESLDTDLSILGWNNNERRFSRTFQFDCFFMGKLSDISRAVTQSYQDIDANDAELGGINTGWLKITAEEGHGILGLHVHMADIGGRGRMSFVAGRELQYTGSRAVTIPRLF